MNNILTIKDLSIFFGETRITKNISFNIKKGEMFALVGESGSGKSVTAMSVMQLLHGENYRSGSIKFKAREILKMPVKELQKIRGNKISMIFQEPMSALNPLHNIGKQITEIIKIHNDNNDNNDLAVKLQNLLNDVGLNGFENRLGDYPHQLSGGERQRVMIAMAIANKPDILIADEPTTALDVTLQKQIIELLNNLRKRYDMAIMLITHDLYLVQKYADNIAIMKDGEIVEYNNTKKLFSNPKHKYSRILLNSKPKCTILPFNKDAKIILRANNICVKFPIKKTFFGRVIKENIAVNNISLKLRKGETLGIVGESGSGKTTLGFSLIALQKSTGDICFKDKNINKISAKNLRELRKEMQFVFQDPFGSLNPRMTVSDIIIEGLSVHFPELTIAQKQDKLENIMSEVGLDIATKNRYPHEFSGGQRQRISIARAVILRPSLIILDEPTSALDLSLQSQILEILQNLQSKHNLSYIFISHDLRVIKEICHNIIVMKDGDILERGETGAIFSTPKSEYTKKLIDASGIFTN